MQAGLYRLKHLGIIRLTLLTSVSAAMSQLPDEAIALATASHIERELQTTPWSLSSNFVACTNQDRENIEHLEITGVGDPSGRGLGFSYVHAAQKAPMSNAMVKKKAAAGRGGSTVTGTNADLRRLSLEAARQVLLKFNVPEEPIAKQTRWHRIAMIRKLSSEQAASGVKGDQTTNSKYARGQRMSFLQLHQQTREKCQEIWDRQVQSLLTIDGDENESDSGANSGLDSFAGDLENLLDAEECEGDAGNYESKHDKADGVKGLKMRRHPSQTQEEKEIEDEAAEAVELCRLLMDDDEVEQKKKKRKVVRVEAGLAPRSNHNFVDRAECVEKTNKVHPNGSYVPKESSIKDSKEINVETLFGNRKISEKVKTMKKNGTSDSSTTQNKAKLKISGEGPKSSKEKKSRRENFFCGACNQHGHMKTNKKCPKYGEETGTQVETADLEKISGKSNSLDPSSKSQQNLQEKKSIPKSTTKDEAPESNESRLKEKDLLVKFKCSSTGKISDTPFDAAAQRFDQPITFKAWRDSSDVETGSNSIAKVNKIKIPNKVKPENVQVEPLKLCIVIQHPMDADTRQIESHKSSIVIQPPSNTEREHVESHKPSIVICPPAVRDREQAHKKIVIKQPEEIIDLDQVSQDGSTGFEYRKIKKIAEVSGIVNKRKLQTENLPGEAAKKKARGDRRWWEEEEKRRNTERLREETRGIAERGGLAELRQYEEAARREREKEEQQKAKKKKRKKKPKICDDYLEDYRASRRIPERDRGAKRPVVELGRYCAEYTPATKRRRGGEVGLANILERIVGALKRRLDVSYLFLKPVSKKEAPDYLDIVKRPMDLSTIREKVRKMEYKHREDFRQDVWQITYNAHLYNNRRNPGIPPLADQLLELCDSLLKEHSYSLSEAEAGIESRHHC